MGNEFIKVEGEIPLNLKKNSYLNIDRKDKRKIYSIGNYPARFIPELPRWAIKKYSKEGDIILDPFCGSGTTLVEGRLNKCNVIGIDHNPIARLLSKVKSSINDIDKIKLKLKDILFEIDKTTEEEVKLPHVVNRDFWFDKQVSLALIKIKNSINKLKDKNIKNFFYVCLCDIIRTVSHVAPGQILQAKRPNHHEEKKLSEKDVLKIFNKKVEEYINTLDKQNLKFNKNNFTRIFSHEDKNKIGYVDLIVSSPPYINAIDYIWAYKLRLHWLGLVKGDNERLNLSSQEVGTERIPKKYFVEEFNTGIKELDSKLNQIRSGEKYKASSNQNELRAQVTHKYFLDMKKHFIEMNKLLNKGGKYCFVIGDNNICKVKILTSRYLIEIAEKNGFKKIFKFNVLLKNRSLNIPRKLNWADKIDFDIMVVFEKVN